ncbi:PH domain-containing protein [Spelaeicoccus albus]|uniref:Low molecular weight protein antigen 6 PH domain-containing protein n=1 Tax=Spelaeicoccus albus TaxID=1280376 RepID=A0A7Z0IHZ5_9MICO|nr:PH domain-containing protein [Spelaeicoccus albus]NYI68060.1 hypothetical protein [Spelaeicoccus albus]
MTFRRISGHATIVVAGIIAALALLTIVQVSGWYGLVHLGALPLLFAALVWAVIERPFVRVTDSGVDIGNILRRIHVPWKTLTELGFRRGLTAITASGTYTAVAVPAPKKQPVGNTLSSSGSPYGDTFTPGSTEASLSAQIPAESLIADSDPVNRLPGHTLSGAAASAANRWSKFKTQRGDAASTGDAKPITAWNKDVLTVCGVLIVLAVIGLATLG